MTSRRLLFFRFLLTTGLFAYAFFFANASGSDLVAAWPVPRGPARAPFRYDADQLKQLPRAFLEDSAACTLYAGIHYALEADGAVEKTTHEITRLNGRKGVERLGEFRHIAYDPSFQTLTLHEARVHKADGKIVPLEPKHAQLRDAAAEGLVYDPDKQLVLSFPNLEVGDVIEVQWTTRGKHPEHQGHFFTRYNFGDERYPVAIDEMTVRLPKKRTLKYAATGGKLDPTIREEGDSRIYHWRATNLPEMPRDDDLPPHEEMRLAVSCSTFASWEEVRQWKDKLRAECWKCTPEIQHLTKEATKDLKTPLEKARALTYWVRRHVRYVSVGEKHDYTPHPPAQVLANRFGDCKDQSQLLAVMLREAGVPVALASLGTRDDGQVLEEVPSPWGTHAILLVTIDGKEHWIDTTISFAAWDYLPRDDRDRLCYVVDDKGLRLCRTPGLKPEDHRVEQTTRLTIAADGSTRSERDGVYHGSAALAQRGDWLEVPPGERRRLMTEELQDAQSRTKLLQLAIPEPPLRDFDQPVTARIVFEVPGHFSGETEREGSLTDSKAWGKLLSHNLDHDRKVALDLTPFESIHRYVLQVTPAYRFDGLPKERTTRSPWGSFTLSVRSDPDKPRELELKFHTRLEKGRVEPADFETFRQFREEVFKHYRVWLTLKPTDDLQDAPELEALWAKTPQDRVVAAALARLYLSHDKREEGRRIVRETRKHCPNDAGLLELSAELAENPQEKEAAYQELIRKHPDEPRYAVALGESRIERGDHEGAKKVLEPILRKGPPHWRGQAHYQLARGHFQQNQPEAALKELEQAAEADPKNENIFFLKGQVLEKLKRFDEAAKAYGAALKIAPHNEKALESLIRLASEKK